MFLTTTPEFRSFLTGEAFGVDGVFFLCRRVGF